MLQINHTIAIRGFMLLIDNIFPRGDGAAVTSASRGEPF
jgi:hypothetical protein